MKDRLSLRLPAADQLNCFAVILPVRALAFERGKLTQFFHKEAEVAGLIYQLLGRDLAHKIKVSNTLLSAGNGLA